MPIDEQSAQRPINPYGWSKLFSERMLFDYAASKKDFAALRYFNVAGSSADGAVGEDHSPETHLIPVILQTRLGRREKFGEDYPTDDGTCVRDYIHVENLVEAHVAVAAALKPGAQLVYNLGIGRGYSVREIIAAARSVIGDFRVDSGPRRERLALVRKALPDLGRDRTRVLHGDGGAAREHVSCGQHRARERNCDDEP